MSLAMSFGLLLLGCRTDDGKKSSSVSAAGATNVAEVVPAATSVLPTAPATPVAAPAPVSEPAATVAESPPAPEPVVTPVSTNAPVARVAPQMPELSPQVRGLVELANTGAGDALLLEFIQNSEVPFDANAADLIYLKDVGLSDDVVAAMLKRSRELRALGVTATPATVAAAPASASPEPAPGTATSTAGAATAPAPSVYDQTVTVPPGSEPAPAAVEAAPPPATNYFYSTLAPYGTWLYIEPYGWCWQPTVAATVVDWRPYGHGGRWLYTTGGWYWQSYYSWGWAPFHYGNWYVNPACGWVWVPGSVWAPAWVTWRYTPAYCGWAPLPPGCGWSAGIGLTYYGGGVSVGFSFGLSSACYTFVGWDHCWHPHPYRYGVPPAQVVNVYNHSTVINNYYVDNSTKTVVNNGIPKEHMPVAARRDLRRVDIKDVQPGARSSLRPDQTSFDGTRVAAYRPNVPADLKTGPGRAAPAPYGVPRGRSSDANVQRTGGNLVPTAIGAAPGSSFSGPQRNSSSVGRSSPTRSGSSPSGYSNLGTASPSVATPSRISPDPTRQSTVPRSDAGSRSNPTWNSPSRTGDVTPQGTPRRSDNPASPTRSTVPTYDRGDRSTIMPTSPSRGVQSGNPSSSSAPYGTGVNRSDPYRSAPSTSPMRSQDAGRSGSSGYAPSRAPGGSWPAAVPNRYVTPLAPPSRSGNAYTPSSISPGASSSAPSRSFNPGASGAGVSPGGSPGSSPAAASPMPGGAGAPSRAAQPSASGSAPNRTQVP